MRAGVRAILASDGETQVVAEAADSAARPPHARVAELSPRERDVPRGGPAGRSATGACCASGPGARAAAPAMVPGGTTSSAGRWPGAERSRRVRHYPARTPLRDNGLEHLTADVHRSRGQRCKGRDRERTGALAPDSPPRGDEQRGEQQQSGLRPYPGGVLYPRWSALGEAGGVAAERDTSSESSKSMVTDRRQWVDAVTCCDRQAPPLMEDRGGAAAAGRFPG